MATRRKQQGTSKMNTLKSQGKNLAAEQEIEDSREPQM